MLGRFCKLRISRRFNSSLRGSTTFMIEHRRLRILGNVGTDEPYFSVINARVGFFDGNLVVADALDFAAMQDNSAIKFIEDIVFVPGPAIGTDHAGQRIV